MFISKKKFEEQLHKARMETAEKWETKLVECEKHYWERDEKNHERERLDRLDERILKCEKKLGLVEETPHCPYEIKTSY